MNSTVYATRRDEALRTCRERLHSFAERAEDGGLALTCVPPLGFEPFPFGDLVPLGFLLMALREGVAGNGRLSTRSAETCAEINGILQRGRQEGLWSYHSGGQVTSIDSALVLLGVEDEHAVQRLEEFRSSSGGYVPQLWTKDGERGRMPLHDEVRHWCQPDRTIACLVQFLRRRHKLRQTVALSTIAEGFDERSGLFIANPWLVDWFYALALEDDSDGEVLRTRLAQDILSSATSDGTFGHYDVSISTAAAVLALATLQIPSSAYSRAISSLESSVLSGAPLPSACPFYSTRTENWESASFWDLLDNYEKDSRKQLIHIHGHPHTITFYEDQSGCMCTALIAMALSAAARIPTEGPLPEFSTSSPHGRYRAATASEYIRQFAMPPYLRPTEG